MPQPKPVTRYHLTNHAQIEMVRRQISDADVDRVLSSPEQAMSVRPGRVVYQFRLEMGNPPAIYLLRIFIDIDHDPAEVVTVYRTSKIGKYWRSDS
jgi:hypothetical protein